MNRPKIEKALTRRMYTDELERYCDELEKALDKACECITHFQALHQGGLNKDKETTCKEWKEWLLKDDE